MDRVVREEDRRTRVENACCFSFLIRIRSVSRKQRRVETINVCVCVCVCLGRPPHSSSKQMKLGSDPN